MEIPPRFTQNVKLGHGVARIAIYSAFLSTRLEKSSILINWIKSRKCSAMLAKHQDFRIWIFRIMGSIGISGERIMMKPWVIASFVLLAMLFLTAITFGETLKYKGSPNLPGSGKHVVLISGDEEYRSEEMVVQFARILSRHHGFDCTVLFAIHPVSGEIDPTWLANIPGLETLKTADVAVFFLRFRDLPEDQMQLIDDYLKSGKSVLGIRTSTHAFNVKKYTKFNRYSFDNTRIFGEWEQGFGRRVLGETWIEHHGDHGKEATRGVIVPEQKDNPIVRGCDDIFGPTDVYRVRLPLPADSKPLVLGQVLTGMTPDSKPVEGPKNNPMMPIAWTKSYQIDDGRPGKAFASTIGSSQDFQSEGVRRLLVNAVYWLAGMEDKIPDRSNVDIVGRYDTLPMGFGKFKKGLKPKDFEKIDE